MLHRSVKRRIYLNKMRRNIRMSASDLTKFTQGVQGMLRHPRRPLAISVKNLGITEEDRAKGYSWTLELKIEPVDSKEAESLGKGAGLHVRKDDGSLEPYNEKKLDEWLNWVEGGEIKG